MMQHQDFLKLSRSVSTELAFCGESFRCPVPKAGTNLNCTLRRCEEIVASNVFNANQHDGLTLTIRQPCEIFDNVASPVGSNICLHLGRVG